MYGSVDQSEQYSIELDFLLPTFRLHSTDVTSQQNKRHTAVNMPLPIYLGLLA